MKDARSVANALLAFAIFLLAWVYFVPGYARATHGPRFLRVVVDDLDLTVEGERKHGRHGSPDRISFSVPWAFVRGPLNAASTGRVLREMDLKIGDPIEAAELRSVWKELSSAPEGTEVVREMDGRVCVLVRSGGQVKIRITPHNPEEAAEPTEATDTTDTTDTTETTRKTAKPPAPPTPPAPQAVEPGRHRPSGTGEVVIVLPARLLEALAGGDEGLSSAALVEELRRAAPGDLVEITSEDGHVKVWLD